MKNTTRAIMLSGRKYQLQDIGEGPTCLLLVHQHSRSSVPLSRLIGQIRGNYRLIIIDITEHFSADLALVSDVEINHLIEDLHLLCDIYWLQKVVIRSDYHPDVIQSKFKAQLFERYQPDLDSSLSKEAGLSMY